MYIELLKHVLVDYNRRKSEYKPLYDNNPSWKVRVLRLIDSFLRKKNYAICRKFDFVEEYRLSGRDWPVNAESMIGLKRMNNIQYCVEQVLKENIPGDFIETGAWRGGATIFMRALLKDRNIQDRLVWVADSFQGLPPPNEKYSADKNSLHHLQEELSVSLEEVLENFKKYGLLDEKVRFLVGWFKDTLPTASIQKLAILRLDGDMYESTMDALEALYPKLSEGGYLIIDDWCLSGCRQAILDYRARHNITSEILDIDGMGAYWKK